jgi:general secretion pathway protein L
MVLTGVIEGFRSQRSLALAAETTHAAASEAAVRRQDVIERIEPLKALASLETTASSSDLMVELSQLVPDGSWLTTFERRDRQVRIVGLSPDAAGMVKRLASSALLSDVSLRSSMSAGIGTGLDRFEITAEFKPASP